MSKWTVLKTGGNYYLVEDAVWYISSSAAGPWRVSESRPEGVEAIPPESPVYNVKYVYIYETTPEVVYVGYTPGYMGSYVYPGAFNDIPEDSPQAETRVYVVGTDEAREAVMDAQIPQTAAVQKGSVDIDVSYDGDPRFDNIDGTGLSYAVNTGSTVLKTGGNYYLVEDAVWYISSSATGPWRVSENRPEGDNRSCRHFAVN